MTVGRVGCALSPTRPAEWTFLVGRGFLAAVPIGTHRDILTTLTALVHSQGVELESVVALLPLTGEYTVESFVVVSLGEPTDEDGIPVSAVVRGEIATDVYSVGGSRRFTDRDIRPWLLADFRAVTGLVIGSPLTTPVPPGELDAGQPVGVGALSGNTLFWSVAGSGPEAEPVVDDTVIRAPARVDDADTIIHPARAPEDTVILRRRDGRPAQPEPGQAATPADRYGFRLPGGPERRLDEVYLLGRHPRFPRIPAGRPPALLTVASPTAAVSATHLEIRQEGDSVVITDLGSTNGTIVSPPRGRAQRLRPGASLVVVPGTTVDIGDGNIIEVLR